MLFIMKNLSKGILTNLAMLVLMLCLGGCAINSASTTPQSATVKKAKVVNQSSKKTTVAQSSTATVKKSQTISQVSANSKVNTSNTDSQTKITTSSAANDQQNISKAPTTQVAPKIAAASPSQQITHQQIQLGLGDTASWTDQQGVTHHVDSDGMDRYTNNGSQEVHYQDWSGSLPQNATVSHNN